jgi:hypothetical protein
LLALTWANVSFDDRTIKVQNSLWNGLIVRPKTESSVRILYVGPLLMNVLREHRGRSVHHGPTDLVFCKPDGQAWNSDVLRKDVLYRVLDRLHIPRPARNSGFHRFRHSAGSFVNARTGNLKLAQKLLATVAMRRQRTSTRTRRPTRTERQRWQSSRRFSVNLFVMFVKIRTTRALR